jgi:hypothetical protein
MQWEDFGASWSAGVNDEAVACLLALTEGLSTLLGDIREDLGLSGNT